MYLLEPFTALRRAWEINNVLLVVVFIIQKRIFQVFSPASNNDDYSFCHRSYAVFVPDLGEYDQFFHTSI